MNFFKSILSDDPEPSKSITPRDEPNPNSPLNPPRDDGNPNDRSDDDGDDSTAAWSFGGLIKTLATRSESVIETYRKDLQEFGSGLKKETDILRETASRAVKDLPASLEAGASAASSVLKSTAEIISKESLGIVSDGELDTPEANRMGRYSWFEVQLGAIQGDVGTFCEEPEDGEQYGRWKSGFELEERKGEIGRLVGENGSLEGVYRKLVPSAVDHETFWCRYFYRVDKLKQQESVRLNLVKRAISVDDEEELSWDVDEDDEENSGLNLKGGYNVASDANLNPVQKQEVSNSGSRDEKEVGDIKVEDGQKESNVVEVSEKSSCVDGAHGEKGEKSEVVTEVKRDEQVKSEEESVEKKNDEKIGIEEKGESTKKSDVSMVSSHQAKEEKDEEDMGWDEIEDIGSGDEKKVSASGDGGSPKGADLRKRLSAAEDDDDDLSWDIEDDDEPVKA